MLSKSFVGEVSRIVFRMVALFQRVVKWISPSLERKFTEWWEELFWEIHLKRWKTQGWMAQIDPEKRKEQFPAFLLPYVEGVRGEGKKIRVLDVGCGPISPLAWGVDQKLFELTAVDPLAEKYATLLQKHGISYPVKPIKCEGENLLKYFEKESFDMVYSRNAIDHAVDIRACMENIRGVLKTGGIFFLEGFVKEGSFRYWSGMHQYDLMLQDGSLCQRVAKDGWVKLSDGFSCLWQEQTGDRPGDWYKIIFKKMS